MSYCGDGCQSGFGRCDTVSSSLSITTTAASTIATKTSTTTSASASITTGTTSIDGNCGGNSDVFATCLGSEWGNCCSTHGFCGGNISYCSTGCQTQYGNCGLDAMTTNTTSSSGLSSGLGKGAIAGISVGGTIGGLAVIGLLVWLAFFRMKRRMGYSVQSEEELKPFSHSRSFVSSQELNAQGNAKHEMDGREFARPELDARVISELPVQHD